VSGWDVLASGWLLVSIVLYLASFLWASLVQNRDLARVLELMEQGTPLSLTEGERAELARRRMRIRYGGLFMRAVVVVVLFLMIAKPF
jgi:uncharacterized membrane protein